MPRKPRQKGQTYSLDTKKVAIARVHAGEAARAVAKDMGIENERAVQRWYAIAIERYPHLFTDRPDDEEVHREASEIADKIKQKQEENREALLDRIADVVPYTDSVKDLAFAYQVITDKARVAEGKPTSIMGEALGLPEGEADVSQLENAADELRRRREAITSGEDEDE